MSMLKMMVVVAVLGGIGYFVYNRIHSGPDAPPPGIADGWQNGATVQMPGDPTQPGGGMWPTPGPGGAAPGGLPTHSPTGDAAPPFAGPPGAVLSVPPGAGPQAGMGHGAPVSPDMAAPGGAPPYGAPSYDPAAGPPAYPPTANAGAGGYAAPPADAAAPWRGGSSSTFQTAMESARRDLDAGRVVEAHQQLSIWYDDPRLSPAEQQQLCELLDQVAGTVVYSTQNLLEAPVEVQPGERLEDIAQRYQVSPQLLAKINGIEDPNSLRPGERLKVVRGPFAAVVNVEKKQLTVLLNGAYAGRFPIGVGAEHPPQEGQFTVTEKALKPTYYGPNRTVDPEDPANPLGKRWIGLGNQLGIHGTNDPANIGRNGLPGCISLGDRDADDVFDILSVGSRVIIRR